MEKVKEEIQKAPQGNKPDQREVRPEHQLNFERDVQAHRRANVTNANKRLNEIRNEQQAEQQKSLAWGPKKKGKKGLRDFTGFLPLKVQAKLDQGQKEKLEELISDFQNQNPTGHSVTNEAANNLLQEVHQVLEGRSQSAEVVTSQNASEAAKSIFSHLGIALPGGGSLESAKIEGGDREAERKAQAGELFAKPSLSELDQQIALARAEKNELSKSSAKDWQTASKAFEEKWTIQYKTGSTIEKAKASALSKADRITELEERLRKLESQRKAEEIRLGTDAELRAANKKLGTTEDPRYVAIEDSLTDFRRQIKAHSIMLEGCYTQIDNLKEEKHWLGWTVGLNQSINKQIAIEKEQIAHVKKQLDELKARIAKLEQAQKDILKHEQAAQKMIAKDKDSAGGHYHIAQKTFENALSDCGYKVSLSYAGQSQDLLQVNYTIDKVIERSKRAAVYAHYTHVISKEAAFLLLTIGTGGIATAARAGGKFLLFGAGKTWMQNIVGRTMMGGLFGSTMSLGEKDVGLLEGAKNGALAVFKGAVAMGGAGYIVGKCSRAIANIVHRCGLGLGRCTSGINSIISRCSSELRKFPGACKDVLLAGLKKMKFGTLRFIFKKEWSGELFLKLINIPKATKEICKSAYSACKNKLLEKFPKFFDRLSKTKEFIITRPAWAKNALASMKASFKEWRNAFPTNHPMLHKFYKGCTAVLKSPITFAKWSAKKAKEWGSILKKQFNDLMQTSFGQGLKSTLSFCGKWCSKIIAAPFKGIYHLGKGLYQIIKAPFTWAAQGFRKLAELAGKAKAAFVEKVLMHPRLAWARTGIEAISKTWNGFKAGVASRLSSAKEAIAGLRPVQAFTKRLSAAKDGIKAFILRKQTQYGLSKDSLNAVDKLSQGTLFNGTLAGAANAASMSSADTLERIIYANQSFRQENPKLSLDEFLAKNTQHSSLDSSEQKKFYQEYLDKRAEEYDEHLKRWGVTMDQNLHRGLIMLLAGSASGAIGNIGARAHEASKTAFGKTVVFGTEAAADGGVGVLSAIEIADVEGRPVTPEDIFREVRYAIMGTSLARGQYHNQKYLNELQAKARTEIGTELSSQTARFGQEIAGKLNSGKYDSDVAKVCDRAGDDIIRFSQEDGVRFGSEAYSRAAKSEPFAKAAEDAVVVQKIPDIVNHMVSSRREFQKVVRESGLSRTDQNALMKEYDRAMKYPDAKADFTKKLEESIFNHSINANARKFADSVSRKVDDQIGKQQDISRELDDIARDLKWLDSTNYTNQVRKTHAEDLKQKLIKRKEELEAQQTKDGIRLEKEAQLIAKRDNIGIGVARAKLRKEIVANFHKKATEEFKKAYRKKVRKAIEEALSRKMYKNRLPEEHKENKKSKKKSNDYAGPKKAEDDTLEDLDTGNKDNKDGSSEHIPGSRIKEIGLNQRGDQCEIIFEINSEGEKVFLKYGRVLTTKEDLENQETVDKPIMELTAEDIAILSLIPPV